MLLKEDNNLIFQNLLFQKNTFQFSEINKFQ